MSRYSLFFLALFLILTCTTNNLAPTADSQATSTIPSNIVYYQQTNATSPTSIADIPTAGVAGVHSSISPAYNATYGVIRRGGLIGTAVLLKCGYLITAGHVIDHNSNQQLDDNEKDVLIHSFVTNQSTRCYAVAFGNVLNPEGDYIDIAVLHPRPRKGVPLLQSDIVLSNGNQQVGLPAFTIGMALGSPPTITDGRVSYPLNDIFGRMSVPICGGHSGGGLFMSSNQNCIGIVTGVAVQQHLHVVAGEVIRTQNPVYHVALYVPAKHIRPIIDHVIEREIEILRAYYIIRLLDEIHRQLGR